MIEHEEVREALELAAIEPGGLDRLIAGDTTEAALVAGHLAGCPACMAEFVRLRNTSIVIRDVLATEPPAELRERTLSFVRAVGRPRGTTVAGADVTERPAVAASITEASIAAAAVTASGSGVAADSGVPPAAVVPGPATTTPAQPMLPTPPRATRGSWWDGLRAALRPGSPTLTWVVATAAVALIAATVTGGILVGGHFDGDSIGGGTEVAALTQISDWTIRIAERPDARRVVLTAATGPAAGTIDLSPGSREMVVIANGLTMPTDTQVYRCWVLIGGQRQSLGQMYFSSDGLAYWVGSVDVLARVGPGSSFGVSLVDSSAPGAANGAILTGSL